MTQGATKSGADFSLDFLGEGEVSRLVRALDWSRSDLGPPEGWSDGLKSAASICMNCRLPFALYWGPAFCMLYNDAFRPMLGDKHPHCFGQRGQEVWAEIWDAIGPMWHAIRETGQGVSFDDSQYFMERSGYREECYFSFSLSPAWGPDGRVEGLVNFAIETTYRVIHERRAQCARLLLAEGTGAQTLSEVWDCTLRTLSTNPADLPFGVLYALEPGTASAECVGLFGLNEQSPLAPSRLNFEVSPESDRLAPLVAAATTGRLQVADALVLRAGTLVVAGAWPEPVRECRVVPVFGAGQAQPGALLVLGVSPRRAFDAAYGEFFEQIARHVGAALGSARAHEDERRRTAALAEVHAAKTLFFDNVSHELRTPLTLLLGHTEEALSTGGRALDGEALRAVHRNALRLLRLVNGLLDFSRVSHGADAATTLHRVPTDVASVTRQTADAFRSIAEKAGLELLLCCPPDLGPALVDREMWEKIVLNLMSIALKYTQRGRITVTLERDAATVRLTVADTGCGIPESELPHLFERFHRVAGIRSRVQESTGIGLALVQEFVRLHGGRLQVSSEVGRGSTFTVELPRLEPDGHVPTVVEQPASAGGARVDTYLAAFDTGTEDALASERVAGDAEGDARPTVLVVDDSPDIVAYIKGLLSGDYRVRCASNGVEALRMIREAKPDLVLSDVVMPELDGLGLLHALRAAPETRTLPVILLSARADPDSAVGGLAAGADDYLAKPFTSQELRARVASHLKLARDREAVAAALRAANAELEARVRERTEQLTDALREMRAFTFSASHDLRTPLRAIDGYSQALLEDYGGILDDSAHGYLERIRKNAQRMGELIDAVLDLGRLGRTQPVCEPLALDRLALEVGHALRASAPNRKVDFVVAPGLTAVGDLKLVTRLLQNLLENAWKFTEGRAEARIEFGVEAGADERVFFVADNGVGFDMAYASRLFEPFQRLHRDDDSPGHGVGLASCREIVRRHGGWMSANGIVDQGAVIRFTLCSKPGGT